MLRAIGIICFFALGVAFAEPPTKLAKLKVGSDVYTNVTIVGVNATDLFFAYANGVKNVKLKYLEPDVQKLFNYDPTAASAAESDRARDEKKFEAGVASRESMARIAAANAAAAAATNANTKASGEDSIADPISPTSPLGKQGPRLDIEKWFGTPPVLKGKFVLVYFWTPWSVPCRKAVPLLNALQKKFPDTLQVIALVSESEAEVDSLDVKFEFASAMDLKGKLHAAAGVTTVPSVLLMDPKGVVLYQGHPAALNEKQLQAIFAKQKD